MSNPAMEGQFEASVLVSGEGLISTLHGMSEKCHFVDFLDFCALTEAIVLNDKIEIVCDVEYAFALATHSAVSKLFDAGVLSTITSHRGKPHSDSPTPTQPTQLPASQYGSRRFRLKGNVTESRDPLGTFTLDQVMDEATSLLRAERELGISVLPMRRFSALYVPNAKVREEHTACDLMSRYEELSAHLRNRREVTRFPITPLAVAQIPAIPVTVLQRARDSSDLLDRILEVRDDYQGLRNALSRLRADLNDEDVPPKEKKKMMDSWRNAWATLDKYNSGSSVAIGNTTAEVLDIDNSVDAASIDFKLSKLLEIGVQQVRAGYRRWRVRILHQTAERYLKLSDGQIHRDLGRLYKRTFGETDLRDLREWEQMIALLPIQLEAMSLKQSYVIERSPEATPRERVE